MEKRPRPRFIAGATCPECRSVDTLQLYFEHNVEKMRCVHCGYSKSQTDDAVSEKTRAQENVIGIFKPE